MRALWLVLLVVLGFGCNSVEHYEPMRTMSPLEGTAGAPALPNVLLIIADDLGAEQSSVYPSLAGDSGQVPMPNLEALAAGGLTFDNAWSSPTCSPTRAGIVTGQHGHHTGVMHAGDILPIATDTVFDRITANAPDYDQAMIGKYHLAGGTYDRKPTVPIQAGGALLQHVADIGMPDFRGVLAGEVVDYFNWVTYDSNASSTATTAYATTALTDYAIDYVQTHAQPWFLYQSFNAPHYAYFNRANGYQVPPTALHSVDLSSVGNPAPGTYAINIPVYKAGIQALDTELGRLLAEVDLETTTVIFIGDNGPPAHVKDTGWKLRGSKDSPYEGAIRVPLVVAGAGVTRTGREATLVQATDLFTTIQELTGGTGAHELNSYSFAGLLSDPMASSGRAHAFAETGQASGTGHKFAIRDSRYKMLWTGSACQLFDLQVDRKEASNKYNSTVAAHVAAKASLQAALAPIIAAAPAQYFPAGACQ